jgi:hypothetical protein
MCHKNLLPSFSGTIGGISFLPNISIYLLYYVVPISKRKILVVLRLFTDSFFFFGDMVSVGRK